ncbi:UNVERIFIED_ORG: hypothetical protein M2438_001223 [Methylobacterium sp. SuP10 SLI 274]|uniref:hypothetical protein n=1 Tax=Methylorubrum extorquens TaxID=408 RepID=UPI00209F78AB|nr:hypothetical protein [Methylorubrum extorquens]MDF9862434.1 hypothetical protein [Methylorubrum pseudosasae]MDH6636048.1 hypothetical protein [Methylobacterium sp. SuP10 SLI 274]MDH6665222.1 hypothetical protein [Methylorubrum zatmanii]MCP1557149.1 hypothetical protein [Methylorubrum extorquens]MDF9790727.1 hypothetical protein [Methylorubrum extorquens]
MGADQIAASRVDLVVVEAVLREPPDLAPDQLDALADMLVGRRGGSDSACSVFCASGSLLALSVAD